MTESSMNYLAVNELERLLKEDSSVMVIDSNSSAHR